MEKINFTAGPSILPKEVFAEMAQGVIDYNGSGLSLLEVSHRGPAFTAIIQEAIQLVKDLLKLPSQYEVLYMMGGASTQFPLIPYNLLPIDGVAGYVDTGTWSTKAIKAAKVFGDVDVCASSEDDQFKFIPKDFKVDPEWAYFHLTSNNTIAGTQLHQVPDSGDVPIVIDMSSDIFSKKIENIEQYGMIYASAQKNLGPSGATLVIIDKNLLGKTNRNIPEIFDYQKHIAKDSVLNTPAVFAIWGCMLTLRWIKKTGFKKIEKDNLKKAELLYAELDNNPLFFPRIKAVEDRSIMNVTFDIKRNELEKTFMVFCENHGVVGIKGHRSVGGFRASLYNAMPVEGVEKLVKLLQDFTWRFG